MQSPMSLLRNRFSSHIRSRESLCATPPQSLLPTRASRDPSVSPSPPPPRDQSVSQGSGSSPWKRSPTLPSWPAAGASELSMPSLPAFSSFSGHRVREEKAPHFSAFQPRPSRFDILYGVSFFAAYGMWGFQRKFQSWNRHSRSLCPPGTQCETLMKTMAVHGREYIF